MPINVVNLSGPPGAPRVTGMNSYNSVESLPPSVAAGMAQQISSGAQLPASPVALRFGIGDEVSFALAKRNRNSVR